MSALVPKVTRELTKLRRTLRETFGLDKLRCAAWRLLHDYFGEAMEEERCGTCDNCVHPLEEQVALPDHQRAIA